MSCSLPDYSPFANYFYTAVGQYALFFCLYWLDLTWLDLTWDWSFDSSIDRLLVDLLFGFIRSRSSVTWDWSIAWLVDWLLVDWLVFAFIWSRLSTLRTWTAPRSPTALPRVAGLARFLPPQYLQPLETFAGPMWLCGTGPSGDTLH